MTAFVTRTIADVIAEIIMSRTGFAGSLLVLEGVEDVKFWKSRVTGYSECQLIQAGGKTTVVGAVVKADQLNVPGVLGIVDNDCDSLLSRSLPSINLIHTEARDIETLMLSTRAFEDVIAELGDDKKIEVLERSEGKTIRDIFISRALIFGQLRYLNSLHNWNVSFATIKPQRFAVPSSWSFDISGMVQEFLRQIPAVSEQDLKAQLANILIENPWSILHGKDSLNVLAIGLRAVIGDCQHSQESISLMLRLAFNSLLFKNTTLYLSVKCWESNNCPYRIVAE